MELGRSLDGVWTLSSYTSFQRPDELHWLALTPAEAEAFEAPRRRLHGVPPSKPGELGQQETEGAERGDGLGRVNGEIRSSWIVDPPDGRIPYTAEARARLHIGEPASALRIDNPEDLGGPDRCIANGAAGAPMFAGPDANLFQIVQTRDAVAILTEKYHDVRIIRLDQAPAPPAPFSAPMGDSVGRWEGRTLVVETSRFQPAPVQRGQGVVVSGETRVVERFTRRSLTELFYAFTVTDPTLFSRPWRGEMMLQVAPGRMYEYACHEGNYSLPSILRGAHLAQAGASATPPAGR